MTDDIVCLLQDLGKDLSSDVIAQFMIINPEVEDLVAAKMGTLLSTNSDQSQATRSIEGQPSTSLPTFDLMALAMSGLQAGDLKMIFVVNMELNMGRGKQCAQVAHAALGLYCQIQQSSNDEHKSKMYQWLMMGQKKIVVKGNNLKHLQDLKERASSMNLPTIIISDAGCTQIAPGSKTVLAVFGSSDQLEPITGSLKLL